ncbi:MAG TPA: hypothetical protein VE645_19020 [Pseudonocardiaceae bacterium]|jgi:hypothetical protein|nr:hypothetical protein [Pseudonocardiaceae bacterium]
MPGIERSFAVVLTEEAVPDYWWSYDCAIHATGCGEVAKARRGYCTVYHHRAADLEALATQLRADLTEERGGEDVSVVVMPCAR